MRTLTTISRTALACLSISSGLAAQSQLATIPLTEEWRISGSQELLVPLGRVHGRLAPSPRGVVAFAQADDHLVRFHTRNGRLLGEYGRQGQGPGEFSNILGLGWRGDTLWVRTGPLGAGQSLVYVGPDLKFLRQVRLPDGLMLSNSSRGPEVGFPPTVLAPLPDGDLLVSVGSGRNGPPAWSGADRNAGATIAVVSPKGVLQKMVGARLSGECHVERPGGGRFPIPLCQDPAVGISPNGRWIVTTECGGTGSAVVVCEIARTSTEGGAQVVSEVKVSPVRIPRHLMDREASLLTGNRPELKALLADTKLPERFAAIRDVLVGDDGVMLLRLGTQPTRHEWLLLDSGGRTVGGFIVGENSQVRAISRTHVWLTVEDRDGLEDIVQYRLGR